MNMKKYLITFYEVENDVWKAHFSYTINSMELSDKLRYLRSLGFIQKEKNNIFIKTFVSDVDIMYLVYTIVEIPINL